MNLQLTSGYSRQALNHSISILNFPNDYTHIMLMNAIKYQYLYGHKDRYCKTKQELNNYCIRMFNENVYNKNKRYICLDIIDILIEFSPDNGHRLTNELRTVERNERNQITEKIKVNTIYKDTQNVHSGNINDSVKKSCVKLMEWYRSNINNVSFEEIKKEVFKENIIIKNVLERIETDISTFNIGFTLKDIFVSLYNWIIKNTNKEELLKILMYEMNEMHGYCATGHLSRLINVLQGFSEDFVINISNYDQCNAVVSNYLNKKLSECEDYDIIEGMTTKGDKYIQFIQNCISNKKEEWKNDYGDEFILNIDKVVNKFIG